MDMTVQVWDYPKNNRAEFYELFLFLDGDSLVMGHSYSRVLVSPAHSSVGTGQSRAAGR